MKDVVVVGGGLAGAKAAQTLREEGYDGRITIVGDEADPPYERPPLSKGYLAGTQERSATYVHPAAWYADHDVDLRSGVAAVELDAAARRVTLADGSVLPYDRALLATGSTARRIPVPGADLDGVHYLRRLTDADALREQFAGGGRRVVVVGGGWIGLETAAAARGYGNDVTVVEPQPTVLYGPMGAEIGGVFADLHRDNGVHLLLGTGVRGFGGARGQVAAVLTDRGDDLEADVVVVGVGAAPTVDLAQSAHLDVDNGVLVDSSLRTSDPAVYAAGDIARWQHPHYGRRVRVEHWDNARASGAAAARAMLGQDVSYDHLPYFYTDQYDLGMEYVGDLGPTGFDRLVFRGDVAGRQFVVFWLKDDRVAAGMNVNVWDVSDAIGQLVRSRAVVDADRLADVDLPLAQLAEEAARA